MSLFDRVSGIVGGLSGKSGEGPGLVTGVLDMLGKQGPGGLAGLIQTFQTKGLGDIVSSWISTGPNLPISPAQLQEALGSQSIRELAGRAGLPLDAVSAKLAEILPVAVDRLTPDGKIPDSGPLAQGLALLRGKLG